MRLEQSSTPGIENIVFCLPEEMDSNSRQCNDSQKVFAGNISEICFSWSQANIRKGMLIDQFWMKDGEQLGGNHEKAYDEIREGYTPDYIASSPTEYSWLRADKLNTLNDEVYTYLPPGTYTVVLVVARGQPGGPLTLSDNVKIESGPSFYMEACAPSKEETK